MSTAISCLGYVSVDHVVALNRAIEPAVTSLVVRRHSEPSGRLGGCAANIAAGLVQEGMEAEVVSWVGDDSAAERVLDQLRVARVGLEGVVRDPRRRTGVTWLPFAPGGESYCMYDPGGAPPQTLTDSQRERLVATDRLVVAVGPAGPCMEALELFGTDGVLLWAVKADPASFPRALAVRLLSRADVIVHNEEEARFLAEMLGEDWPDRAAPDALRVQTLGVHGVRYFRAGATHEVRLERSVDLADAVGAGDRFCAGLLAGLADDRDPDDAVRAGIESAARLLRDRRDHERAYR